MALKASHIKTITFTVEVPQDCYRRRAPFYGSDISHLNDYLTEFSPFNVNNFTKLTLNNQEFSLKSYFFENLHDTGILYPGLLPLTVFVQYLAYLIIMNSSFSALPTVIPKSSPLKTPLYSLTENCIPGFCFST